MPRYHLTPDNVPKLCKAKPGECPLGGEHFTTRRDAENASEKAFEHMHNNRPTPSLKHYTTKDQAIEALTRRLQELDNDYQRDQSDHTRMQAEMLSNIKQQLQHEHEHDYKTLHDYAVSINEADEGSDAAALLENKAREQLCKQYYYDYDEVNSWLRDDVINGTKMADIYREQYHKDDEPSPSVIVWNAHEDSGTYTVTAAYESNELPYDSDDARDEAKTLQSWIAGQNSDGIGESLEQCELDGKYYKMDWQPQLSSITNDQRNGLTVITYSGQLDIEDSTDDEWM